jgi:hypothetical protein
MPLGSGTVSWTSIVFAHQVVSQIVARAALPQNGSDLLLKGIA